MAARFRPADLCHLPKLIFKISYSCLSAIKMIFKISTQQIKAARALLGWKQEHLARIAGVSIATVRRLEAKPGDLGGYASTGKKLVDALEAAGIEFTNGSQPGVRLKAKPSGPSPI
jgi:DNA-binding transcriptional regulator YiaG